MDKKNYQGQSFSIEMIYKSIYAILFIFNLVAKTGR